MLPVAHHARHEDLVVMDRDGYVKLAEDDVERRATEILAGRSSQ